MRRADDFPKPEARPRADADERAFQFEFDLWRDEDEQCIHLWGQLHRRGPDGRREVIRIDELAEREGDVFRTRDDRRVTVAGQGVPPLVDSLRRDGSIRVPFDRESQLRTILARIPWHTTTESRGAHPETDAARPRGHMYVDVDRNADGERSAESELGCRLSFLYGDTQVHAGCGRMAFLVDSPADWIQTGEGTSVRRDPMAERALAREFLSAGGRVSPQEHDHDQGRISRDELPAFVSALIARDWVVEANGKRILSGDEFRGSVQAKIDWLELRGGLRFGDHEVGFPDLLRAAKSGIKLIPLPGGGFGVISESWLNRLQAIARLSSPTEDGVCRRFKPNQSMVLDALLAADQGTQLEVDEAFAELRGRVRRFSGFRPRPTPEGFAGTLRPYQRDALGWIRGLADLGLGGCLADDMGLGKTVQVLAALHDHYAPELRPDRRLDPEHQPSIIVAPSSLVFNWQREAAKFSPKLRTLAYIGPHRSRDPQYLRRYDVLLTTYGTLRQDIEFLQDTQFDYVVLDEAQAIKSSNSLTAKATRLVRGKHRLALSGTPIENHLGELWSLFEFLNPGMLGRAHDFKDLVKPRPTRSDGPDEDLADRYAMLSEAVRPFFLRRTKRQVLKELPAKTEQTIFCELGDVQRREYDILTEHYQQTILADRGTDPTQMHVLEALLRLRQAASHLGLLDPTRAQERGASAKLDVLVPMLEELTSTGHKALVFSQFTTFLGLTREALHARGLRTLYLDGATRDRQAQVDAFQHDKRNQVFLISIKAGGAGLNLTAADYVFLLDPWWNPAAEAQAIDRSHRMGQRRKVTAYRLIAAGTIEEKVRRLQEQKRELADAVFGADNAELRKLTRENLQALLE